jgi:hypothetical protein
VTGKTFYKSRINDISWMLEKRRYVGQRMIWKERAKLPEYSVSRRME